VTETQARLSEHGGHPQGSGKAGGTRQYERVVLKHYKAPWSTSLIIISSLVTVLCAGLAISFILSRRGPLSLFAWALLAIIFGSALFTIRGYKVTSDAILIQRLFWTSRLPLSGLKSAQFEPNAMRGSLRTFGNGGLFLFTGFFRNKPLGAYRAFVTDPHRTVVLRFPSRTIVLSPSVPEEFVHELTVASHAA